MKGGQFSKYYFKVRILVKGTCNKIRLCHNGTRLFCSDCFYFCSYLSSPASPHARFSLSFTPFHVPPLLSSPLLHPPSPHHFHSFPITLPRRPSLGDHALEHQHQPSVQENYNQKETQDNPIKLSHLLVNSLGKHPSNWYWM